MILALSWLAWFMILGALADVLSFTIRMRHKISMFDLALNYTVCLIAFFGAIGLFFINLEYLLEG